MHIAPEERKCLLHEISAYPETMLGPGERLKEARMKAGYSSAKAAAEAMGVPVATYIQHENGHRGIPASRAARYAKFFRTSPEWLIYGKDVSSQIVTLGPQLFVVGEVEAGVFKEAWKADPLYWQAFTGRSDLAIPLNQRFGLKVSGRSMDLIYPPGTILECIEYQGQVLESGRRVIVQRTRVDGAVEATVKELVRGEDEIEWLVPRSTDPQFQAFRADQPGDGEVASVEIIGIVVASTRLE